MGKITSIETKNNIFLVIDIFPPIITLIYLLAKDNYLCPVFHF